MDKRKDTISSLKMCRFCLTQDVPMTSIYDKKRKIKSTVNLPLKILSCLSVEVFPSDKMPTYICERCKYFMNLFYDFKHLCRQADEAILHYIQDNKPFKAIVWPVSLNDVYRESNDIGVMKTVVEDGTTVQVTHDMSDSEEDEEENVYNVKINDGSDEVSKTCIKVVASRNNDDKLGNKGSGERCWPCDECNCTYPLQQLLELHKMKKHRQRTVSCEECGDKFFNKNDLAIHQQRHSDGTPYQCVACGRKFKRIILLKRHEKLIHSDLAQQACPHCPATFLSCDELAEHRKKHERSAKWTYTCALCEKKYHDRSTLRRHIRAVHTRALNFACEYCPQRYASVTKLARHVRTHAGERPYPCKYCDKTFMKSHHYTRHVRLKHPEVESARPGAGAAETYRCEQCEISFPNQDDLIYHSAIHATQNLTCPLCQEKFDNVDAVTTHIKSHVNGMEFMCDYCELVFTSKEKLENHMVLSHEDEIQHEELGQDESSMEAEDIDGEADDDDDNCINVKEEDDHMVIEIKKADNFLLKDQQQEPEEKLADNSNSEESDSERAYIEHAAIEKLATVKKITPAKTPAKEIVVKPTGTTSTKQTPQVKPVVEEKVMVRKPEEPKRVLIQQKLTTCDSPVVVEKKEKQTMAQVTKIETGNDKSLRLLEKELQDLKRTNSRSEAVKTPPVKVMEAPKVRGRAALHTSTPKIKKGIYRPTEEKKTLVIAKTPAPTAEKKQAEKKVITKENKEPPKVVKETKPNNIKEDKDTNKNVVKNGTNDKSATEDGIRRSTRPSKIKDYAKMIRVNTQENSDSDELEDDDDEYGDKNTDSQGRVRARRNSVRPHKGSPAPAAATPPATPATLAVIKAIPPPRKRGRPRKDAKDIPTKILKTGPEAETESEPTPEAMEENLPPPETNQSIDDTKQDDDSQDSLTIEPEADVDNKQEEDTKKTTTEQQNKNEERKSPNVEQNAPPSPSKLISPTGQTLKKIPIRSLPPGVKPLPLPLVNRTISPGELCEMQIGKKVVKVQKIVMTKAEVEAMAKKGLVEMKDGTMVLKQGVKIPKVEQMAVKTVTAEEKDSPNKREKAAPTRCNLGDD